jgi:hypothetical protein
VKKPVPTAQTDATKPEEKAEATPVPVADSAPVVLPAPELGQEPETPPAAKRPLYRPKIKKPDVE